MFARCQRFGKYNNRYKVTYDVFLDCRDDVGDASVLLVLQRLDISFQYPSTARCYFFVVTFGDAIFFEAMTFVELLRGLV